MLNRGLVLSLALTVGGCPEPSSPEPSTETPKGSAATTGFPQYDPQREVTLFGRLLGDEPPILPEAITVGDWTTEGGRLLPSEGEPRVEQWWFPTVGAASLTNGMIRARLEVHHHLDVTILVRHGVHADSPTMSGYGVSIEKGKLSIDRWDAGVAQPMVPQIALRSLATRSTLEVVIVVVGAQILASVYDGETLEQLASAAAHDATYADGYVGVRMGPAHDSHTAVTFLATMDATTVTSRATSPHHEPDLGLGRDEGDDRPAPIGDRRYVFLAASDAVALPGWARARVRAWDDSADGERAVLLLGPVAYERLVRTGVPIAAVEGDVGWKVHDPEFRARPGKGPEPRGRGFVLDDSYKDPEMVADLLRAYHLRHPDITELAQIGESHQGRPIWALKISDHADLDEDEPPVLFDGAHHAGELLTIEYVLDIVDTLLTGHGEEARITKWIDGAEIWCVPVVNPDGVHRFVHDSIREGRKNARDLDMDGFVTPFEGVDINRNYPFGWGGQRIDYSPLHRWYRGPAPASEPEVQAIMQLATNQRFAAVFSFHSDGTDIYPPYLVAHKREVVPDVFRAIAEELVAPAPRQPGGKFYGVRAPPHPVDGCAHDWHTHEYGAAAYVVESSHNNPEPETRRLSIEGVRPVWMGLLDRVLDGRWISGRVGDSAGDPVVAEVMLKEIETFEGESWKSRARDGRFDRAIAEPGTYTLVASADGYAPVERAVEVGSQRVDVAIVLSRVSESTSTKRRD